MREEYPNYLIKGKILGITPAHAGRIATSSAKPSAIRDHPRACGKNAYLLSDELEGPGSPPRMREESQNVKYNGGDTGITPAHAGRILKNSINIAILYQLLP